MISTVIFDLDGTLLNTLDDLANSGNYTLSQLSFPTHPVESFRLMVGNGIKKLMYRMLPEHARDEATLHLALAIFTEYYNAHALVNTQPYPGILPALDSLLAAGKHLAVLSNKNDEMVQKIVSHYFGDRFALAWGLRPEYPPKPDPCSLLALLDALGTSRECAIYCGDSNVDIITANNADIASCGVTWGFRTRDELKASGAHFIIDSPNQFVNIAL